MRKLKILLQCIALFAALSCNGGQYGPSEDEAYAGSWIGESELGIEEVIEMTDTTFEAFARYQGLNGFVPAYKGFISKDKESGSRIFFVTTDIYQLDQYTVDETTRQIQAASRDGEYITANEISSVFSVWNYRTFFDYEFSGDTITYNGEYTMLRTSPVSDNLLE